LVVVVFVQGPMSSVHFARFSKMLNTLGLPLLFKGNPKNTNTFFLIYYSFYGLFVTLNNFNLIFITTRNG